MQILYELVTVIREQEPRYHWETGKMADAMISKPGDLPCRRTEKTEIVPLFQGHE